MLVLALILASIAAASGEPARAARPFTRIKRPQELRLPAIPERVVALTTATESRDALMKELHRKVEVAKDDAEAVSYKTRIFMNFFDAPPGVVTPEMEMNALEILKAQEKLSAEALAFVTTAYANSGYMEVRAEAESILRGNQK